MSRATPTALARLRRHRGVLWLLAFAFVVKLAAGTVCLADGLNGRASCISFAPAMAALSVDTAASSINEDGDRCVLGEPGGCHCACAHTATLPASIAIAFPRIDTRFDAPIIAPDFVPATMASLLRPPIT
jgi:hypothetical protein